MVFKLNSGYLLYKGTSAGTNVGPRVIGVLHIINISLGDLFRSGNLPKERTTRYVRQSLRATLSRAVQICVGVAGADKVDAERGKIEGERPGETKEACANGGHGGSALDWPLCGAAGGEGDRRRVFALEVLGRQFGDEYRHDVAKLHSGAQVRNCYGGQRRNLELVSRVDEVVKLAAQFRGYIPQQLVEAFLSIILADIDGVAGEVGIRHGRPELLKGAIDSCWVGRRDDNVGTFGAGKFGDTGANAGRAANDENVVAADGGHVDDVWLR